MTSEVGCWLTWTRWQHAHNNLLEHCTSAGIVMAPPSIVSCRSVKKCKIAKNLYVLHYNSSSASAQHSLLELVSITGFRPHRL